MRQTPRVILRTPRRGRFGEEEVLVLEMGLGGSKFEHATRLDVGRAAVFVCGPLSVEAVVRHSILLPARTGVVYQSGVSFPNVGPAEHDLLLDLLVHEAQEQVVEWEANLQGIERAQPAARKAGRRSAAAPRFLALTFDGITWRSKATADPNQPPHGVTVLDTTPEEELAVLRQTYENSDASMREFMRRVATMSILEAMR
jgi:hypothetical protein